jgi:hypothetical protein
MVSVYYRLFTSGYIIVFTDASQRGVFCELEKSYFLNMV